MELTVTYCRHTLKNTGNAMWILRMHLNMQLNRCQIHARGCRVFSIKLKATPTPRFVTESLRYQMNPMECKLVYNQLLLVSFLFVLFLPRYPRNERMLRSLVQEGTSRRAPAPRLVWNFDTTRPLSLHNSVMPKDTSSWNCAFPIKSEARKQLITRKVKGAAGATHMAGRITGKRRSKGKQQLP